MALTIEELADATSVPVRTIRYYIAEGLLPGPGARGRAAAYSQDQLLRLQLIRLLVEQRVPLAEIRERLSALSAQEVRSLLQEETRRQTTLSRVAEAPSPKAYIGALLERARAHRPPVLSSPPPPPLPLRAVASAAEAWPAATSIAAAPSIAKEAAPSPSTEPLTWRRQELAPGIELHVRSDVERDQPDLVKRLFSLAGATVAAVSGRGRSRP